MRKESVKEKIVSYLLEKRDWVWGGNIERAISEMTGSKGDMIARRLRELSAANILVEKRYAELVDGKMEFVSVGGSVVYRYKQPIQLTQTSLV